MKELATPPLYHKAVDILSSYLPTNHKEVPVLLLSLLQILNIPTREYPVYELAKENYLTKTKKDKRYSAVGKDQCKRDFAVCPACDNPIQIIGVYKKLENTSFTRKGGNHYRLFLILLQFHRFLLPFHSVHT